MKLKITQKIFAIGIGLLLTLTLIALIFVPQKASAENVATETTNEGNGFYNLEGYTTYDKLYKLFDFTFDFQQYITVNYGFYVPVVQGTSSAQYSYASMLLIYATYTAINPMNTNANENSYFYYPVMFEELFGGSVSVTNYIYGVPNGIAKTNFSSHLLEFHFAGNRNNANDLNTLLINNGILNKDINTSVYRIDFKQLSNDEEKEPFTELNWQYSPCFFMNNSNEYIIAIAFDNSALSSFNISCNTFVRTLNNGLSYTNFIKLKDVSTSLYFLNGYQGLVNEISNKYYNSGYTKGYDNGYAQATSDSEDLWGYIKSIGEVPFVFVNSWLNFELMGVNLRDLVTAIFSTCLVIAVVKLLI